MPPIAQIDGAATGLILGGIGGLIGVLVGAYLKIRGDQRADKAAERAAKAQDAKEEAERKTAESEKIRLEIDDRLEKQQRNWDHIAELSKAQQDDHLRAREERAAYKAQCEWQEARIAELKAEKAEISKRITACSDCPALKKGG